MRRAEEGAKIQTACPEDFLTPWLVARRRPRKGLTRGEVEDNIITFIGAGHRRTTARALGWAIYMPSPRAPWEARAHRGGDRTGASASNPRSEPNGWTRCPLTRGGLRGGPCGSIRRTLDQPRAIDPLTATRDLVESEKGAQDSWSCPGRSSRHRQLWDRPDAFMPRTLSPPGNREKLDRYQYLPFGAGPAQICIGAQFASRRR